MAASDKELGFKQSFLRGHSHPVGLIEVSEKEVLMVTGETSTPNGTLILWDAKEGRRLATLMPHTGTAETSLFFLLVCTLLICPFFNQVCCNTRRSARTAACLLLWAPTCSSANRSSCGTSRS